MKEYFGIQSKNIAVVQKKRLISNLVYRVKINCNSLEETICKFVNFETYQMCVEQVQKFKVLQTNYCPFVVIHGNYKGTPA